MEKDKKPSNPYAFPLGDDEPGMTMRDYFAIHVLGSIIQGNATGGNFSMDANKLAKQAYDLAEGMLKQREK